MNPAKRISVAILILVAIALGASPALAQQQPQVTVTSDQARAAALAAVPGTALQVELEQRAGRLSYEVLIQPQSGARMVEVLVDATSGAVLGNPERAGAAALAAVPGTLLKTEFKSSRMVFEVEIQPQSGGSIVEVLVDATNNTVLGNQPSDNQRFGVPGTIPVQYFDD